MSKPSDPRCCADSRCESGLKNHYYAGKRLTADSFRLEQEYQIERRWLLNRAIHGWGVVYGYEVAAAPPGDCHDGPGTGRLRIGPGLALDRCGRELLQVGRRAIALADVVPVDADGRKLPREKAFHLANDGNDDPTRLRRRCWLLSVHYAEEHHGTVKVSEPCSCERNEHDHVCETVRYSLREVPCEECCRDWPCELQCGCGSGDCCGEHAVAAYAQSAVAAQPAGDEERALEPHQQRLPQQPPAHQPPPDHPVRRGGCRCLCDSLTALQVGGDCGLCEVEEPCGKVWVDLAHGVPLACVDLVSDECDRPAFGAWIEPCGPRRLVKRNDLLFDLIRGCDLTRISDIGWKDWHRRPTPITLAEFSLALGPPGEGEEEYVANAFWVEFSRPVRGDTLLPDCFAMTVMSSEHEGGWWQSFRVPIVRVKTSPADDPHGHVRRATLVFDGRWCEDEPRGRRSLFLDCDVVRVEIEVRGDFIVDCNGQPVDANAVGLLPIPSGNGTPGGTFLSTFCVAAPPQASARPAAHAARDLSKGASS